MQRTRTAPMTTSEIKDITARLGPRGMAELAQQAADLTLVWQVFEQDGLTRHVAETPSGTYDIQVYDMEGMVSIYVSSPINSDRTSGPLDEDDVDDPESAVRRIKAQCAGQYAWLLTNDTSYAEVPEDLDF